jgi:hypothetical protein
MVGVEILYHFVTEILRFFYREKRKNKQNYQQGLCKKIDQKLIAQYPCAFQPEKAREGAWILRTRFFACTRFLCGFFASSRKFTDQAAKCWPCLL